jgi:DNA-binding transcriptional MerR regulator
MTVSSIYTLKGATMTQQHYSLGEVARIVGVRAHRISFALSSGFIPEPAERITNRRMFTEADIETARRYFAAKSNKGRPARKEGSK